MSFIDVARTSSRRLPRGALIPVEARHLAAQLAGPLVLGLAGPLGAQAQALLFQEPPLALPQLAFELGRPLLRLLDLLLEVALALGHLAAPLLAQRGAGLRRTALVAPGRNGGQRGEREGEGQKVVEGVGEIAPGELDPEQEQGPEPEQPDGDQDQTSPRPP